MKDTEIIQWVMDHKGLINSTKKATRDEVLMIFTIANLVDNTQTHKPTSCGRCYESAKRAIMKNLPTLF